MTSSVCCVGSATRCCTPSGGLVTMTRAGLPSRPLACSPRPFPPLLGALLCQPGPTGLCSPSERPLLAFSQPGFTPVSRVRMAEWHGLSSPFAGFGCSGCLLSLRGYLHVCSPAHTGGQEGQCCAVQWSFLCSAPLPSACTGVRARWPVGRCYCLRACVTRT